MQLSARRSNGTGIMYICYKRKELCTYVITFSFYKEYRFRLDLQVMSLWFGSTFLGCKVQMGTSRM